ncbi:MAG: phage tail tape measure protein, partial [Candidatus Competibacteraceae bacterium]|nr:phage tail tape measure protein [Candidatus Competibacteraceae bacterium]
MPGASARITELKGNVQDLAAESGKGTRDLTQGLYQIISAFGDSAEAAGQLELASKAATAGAASTLESINLLSAVTKGYGDASLEAQKKVGDLAFTTVKLGQTTFPELAASIQQVVPQSKALGVSQEELFSIFAAGTGVIGSASEVATKYRASREPHEAGERDDGNLRPPGGRERGRAHREIRRLRGSLGAVKREAEEAGIPFQDLFSSSEALTLALSFTGAQADTLREKLASLRDSSGALDEAYTAATEGTGKFAHELDQARAAAEVLAQRFGEELLGSAEGFLLPLLEIVRGLAEMDEETLRTVISIGKLVAVAASATLAVVAVEKALIGAKAAFLAFKATAAFSGAGLAIIGLTTANGAWFDATSTRLRELVGLMHGSD